MKNRVLLVGEHPYGPSGNSGMTRGILSQININRFDVACFSVNAFEIDFAPFVFSIPPFTIIHTKASGDPWGKQQLLEIISKTVFDILFFVGIDIWRYADIFPAIIDLRNQKKFKWIFLFPYDLQTIRKDWVLWASVPDFPRVYSKYGEEALKPYIPNIEYFRPQIQFKGIWKPIQEDEKKEIKKRLFLMVSEGKLIFGFIGTNAFRKDIQGLIKAFSIAKKECPNVTLYLHTTGEGRCNILQAASDYGLAKGDVLLKPDNQYFVLTDMVSVYNSIDCLVNCTMQEGLSWTPLEAMLCGTPVIASNSTAHPELIGDAGILVPCKEPSYIPLLTKFGESWLDGFSCKPENTARAIVEVAKNPPLRDVMRSRGLERSRQWLEGVSDVNKLFEEALKKEEEKIIIHVPVKKEAVLFAQHSAAGDVLMTTRCFKGLKERHPDLPLYYMTLKQYIDIVTNNPYLDRIIPWDENRLKDPKYIVINPHGDRILPGHWGRNSNSILSDFYWKVLDVVPGDFFIEEKRPYGEIVNRIKEHQWDGNRAICIVHTTGGDAEYRTYKYMGDVCREIKPRFCTVQLGGEKDYPAWADIDLRGRLSFRESAWVMSQATVAITVDSFMSHLAGALGVSQVCLFGSGNYFVVKPNQVMGKLICLSPDYVKYCPGLGPCSQSVRDCAVKCTGSHDPETIIESLEELLKSE